jgi:hypothetical protein
MPETVKQSYLKSDCSLMYKRLNEMNIFAPHKLKYSMIKSSARKALTLSIALSNILLFAVSN